MTPPLNIAILGASGYTGAELIRLLLAHPHARIAALTGDAQAGKPVDDVYPHLAGYGLPDLVTIEQVNFAGIDTVFCALPHGTTQEVIAGLPAQLRIIDLSADFRLADVEVYARWYGHAHKAVELQKGAVYGLTEHAREAVRGARLVANPGCYPTASQLPLVPLLRAGLIAAEDIIIDAKSGVTGAGRAAKQANLFTELDGGMSAYGIGRHRHTPEIEQGLSAGAGKAVRVIFTPHLVPMPRGILATIYVSGEAKAIRAELARVYANEPFVHVLPEGAPAPSTHSVRGSNHCRIGVYDSGVAGRAVIVSVIDNLVKGASGQAVQNFNVMYGFDETRGLAGAALFP